MFIQIENDFWYFFCVKRLSQTLQKLKKSRKINKQQTSTIDFVCVISSVRWRWVATPLMCETYQGCAARLIQNERKVKRNIVCNKIRFSSNPRHVYFHRHRNGEIIVNIEQQWSNRHRATTCSLKADTFSIASSKINWAISLSFRPELKESS